MKLTGLDLSIIAIYLVSVALIGFVLRRRAASSLDSYLMGGKTLPWYFLGVSNASGQFDISGTMWLVTIGFVYGLKSIWLPWLWPTFNQVFLAVFLSAWLRRSNVTTGAQWIETRFGKGAGSTLSHAIVVIFALIGALGLLAYGFVGLGKFVQIFILWEAVQPYVGFQVAAQYVPYVYGIVFTLAAVLYTVLGGMTSIVMADLLQYTIMTVSGIVVAVIAMTSLAHHPLNVPEGWMSPWFGWNLNLDRTGIIAEVNRKIAEDQFSLFSIAVMLILFKGILSSVAGPAPNYDMQKILATRSPREASLMSAFVNVVLYFPRYLLGTFLAKLTDEETLKSFYRNVRPWGAWGPIRKLVEAEDPKFERNRGFKRDMVNVFVGMIWQTAVAVAILAVASVFLKKNWYDRLPAQ
jgi:Na+/proline symporter